MPYAIQEKAQIFDELTLSRDELLKVAAEMSVKDRVILKTDHAHLQLHEERRMIENAFLATRQKQTSRQKELPALSEWFYDNRTFFMEQIKLLEQ